MKIEKQCHITYSEIDFKEAQKGKSFIFLSTNFVEIVLKNLGNK